MGSFVTFKLNLPSSPEVVPFDVPSSIMGPLHYVLTLGAISTFNADIYTC